MEYSEIYKTEEFTVKIPEIINRQLLEHLIREDGQEDLIFALWQPSIGNVRYSSLITEIIHPNEADRQVHGNVSFNTQYLIRAMNLALSKKMGLAFIHSHPFPGWQDMSHDDVLAERQILSNVDALLDFPLVGLTVGSDGTWSGRIWYYSNEEPSFRYAKNIRVVGNEFKIYFHEAQYKQDFDTTSLKRTINVWGLDNQSLITRLRIGLVGLGSVGSILAEMTARQGIKESVLIDFDKVEEHNLDRLLTANRTDIGKFKVDIAKARIAQVSNTDTPHLYNYYNGIQYKSSYKGALDCDILFSCVDRPWPRHIQNHIAYAHLVPVIDGGIGIRISQEKEIDYADWQSQIVAPGRPCMLCLGTYDKSDVELEKSGKLDDPEYIKGLDNNSKLKQNENVFPFSMNLASNMFMQFISYVLNISPEDYQYPLRFRFLDAHLSKIPMENCQSNCEFDKEIGIGDKYFKVYIKD
jgi:hypothetical protein